MKLNSRSLTFSIGILISVINNTVNASSLTGLQECQAIKNAVKKADCFEKQTQKMIVEENEKKQREEKAKIESDRIKAEADKAKVEAEKIALEEKRIASEIKKLDKAQKIMQIIMRLQTRVQTGVSYRDYSSVMSDPKFEVQSYIRESRDEIPTFTENIYKAMNFYDVAGNIWGFKFAGRGATDAACDPLQQSYIRMTLIGVYVPNSQDLRNYCEGPNISSALKAAWGKASESIDAANAILQNMKTDLNKEPVK